MSKSTVSVTFCPTLLKVSGFLKELRNGSVRQPALTAEGHGRTLPKAKQPLEGGCADQESAM